MSIFSVEFKNTLPKKSLKNIDFFEKNLFKRINYKIFLKDLTKYVCNYSIENIEALKKALVDIIFLKKDSDRFFKKHSYLLESNLLILDFITAGGQYIDFLKNNYSLLEELRRHSSTELNSLLRDYYSELYDYLNEKSHDSNYSL